MKRLLLASVSAFALFGGAQAADLGVPVLKAAPPPPANWSGFYVGIAGGVARHDAYFDDLDGAFGFGNGGRTYSTEKTGGIFGGYAGINFQDRSFVYGAEADFSGLSVKATETWNNGGGATNDFDGQSQNVPWVATFRGRLGLDLDSTLVYVTGGLAVGKVENSMTHNCRMSAACGPTPAGGAFAGFTDNSTRVGWTAGVGVEHLFLSHWTLRGEFRYIDLGTKSATCSAITPGDNCGPPNLTYRGQFSNTLMTGLVGLGYKF